MDESSSGETDDAEAILFLFFIEGSHALQLNGEGGPPPLIERSVYYAITPLLLRLYPPCAVALVPVL